MEMLANWKVTFVIRNSKGIVRSGFTTVQDVCSVIPSPNVVGFNCQRSIVDVRSFKNANVSSWSVGNYANGVPFSEFVQQVMYNRCGKHINIEVFDDGLTTKSIRIM